LVGKLLTRRKELGWSKYVVQHLKTTQGNALHEQSLVSSAVAFSFLFNVQRLRVGLRRCSLQTFRRRHCFSRFCKHWHFSIPVCPNTTSYLHPLEAPLYFQANVRSVQYCMHVHVQLQWHLSAAGMASLRQTVEDSFRARLNSQSHDHDMELVHRRLHVNCLAPNLPPQHVIVCILLRGSNVGFGECD